MFFIHKFLLFFSNSDSEDDPEMDDEMQEAYEEFLKSYKP